MQEPGDGRSGVGMKSAIALVCAAAAVVFVLYIIFEINPGDRCEGIPTAGKDLQHASGGIREWSDEPGNKEEPRSSEKEPLLPAGGPARFVLVKGKVVDRNGSPFPDVVVAFRGRAGIREDGESSEESLAALDGLLLKKAVKSGPEGLYETAIPSGRYRLSAHIVSPKRSHGLWFEPEELQIPAVKEFVKDIVFSLPLCEIRGTALRAGGGPIENLGVALCSQEGRFFRRRGTDQQGKFSFPQIAPGTYRLRFERGGCSVRGLLFPWQISRAPEKSPERWPEVRVEEGDREIVYDLTLATPVRLTASVAPPQGGWTPGLKLCLLQAEPVVDAYRIIPGESRPARAPLPALGQKFFYSSPIREKGDAVFSSLFPGKYIAAIHGLPDGQARPDPLMISIDSFPEEQKKIFPSLFYRIYD